MRRAAACCLAAALCVGGLTACGSGPGAGGSESFERSNAAELILGPKDLGRGYAIGDDSGCGSFAPEGEEDRFTEFVYEARPAGCTNEIAYIWGGQRTTVVPRGVESGIAVFDDEADARKAMEMRSELIQFMVAESPGDFEELPDFGHEAARFRNRGYDVPVGAGVIWRNANTLAVVFAGGPGMTRDKASEAALELAEKQQERIEHPRKPDPAEGSRDTELPLDDPTLDVPVYWLGRTFEPGGGLPALELARVYGGSSSDELGFTVEMDYGATGPSSGVKIWVFSPTAFEEFKRGILGRLVTGTNCADKTEVKVPLGRALVWAGFAKPERAPCPTRPYDRYVAYVYLEGAVVAINQPWCLYPCSAPEDGASYNTSQGVLAIAKGLRVREPRPS